MDIKAKCVDYRYSTRGHVKLEYGKVYRITGFVKGYKQVANFVTVKGFPGVHYLARRFQIIDKKIILNLPDDLQKIPL
jgi:hypothetical protein